MTTKHPQKIFIEVDCKDEMPPRGLLVSVSFDNGKTYSFEAKGKEWKANEVRYTHWLKETTAIIFTPEELEQRDLDNKKQMHENMQYYMEYCEKNGYVTPMDWLEKHKHF